MSYYIVISLLVCYQFESCLSVKTGENPNFEVTSDQVASLSSIRLDSPRLKNAMHSLNLTKEEETIR